MSAILKKKIKVIANPISGTSSKDNIQQLLERYLDKIKYDFELCYTTYAGHASVLAAAAVKEGYFMCVAAGGDGTVNEIASQLRDTNVVLGVLPYGSGNGFAGHIGIKRDVIKGIEIFNKGTIHRIDTCSANNRFFLNISGIGLDASVAYKTKFNKKRGFLPYFITTLKESLDFKYLDLEIETEDRATKGSYAMVVVANASIYGYDFAIVPTADLEDGLIDVLLVKKVPVYRYFFAALRMINKSFHKSPLVHFLRVKQITIKTATKTFIHVDGEGFEADKVTIFRVHPKSLNVMFPSDWQ